MRQHSFPIVTDHIDHVANTDPQIAMGLEIGAVPIENPVAALQKRIYDHFADPQVQLNALTEDDDDQFEDTVTLISRLVGVALFVGSLVALGFLIF